MFYSHTTMYFLYEIKYYYCFFFIWHQTMICVFLVTKTNTHSTNVLVYLYVYIKMYLKTSAI